MSLKPPTSVVPRSVVMLLTLAVSVLVPTARPYLPRQSSEFGGFAHGQIALGIGLLRGDRTRQSIPDIFAEAG